MRNSSLRAGALAFFLGTLLCLARRGWAEVRLRGWSPGPVVYWVVDRTGQALVGLDRELFCAEYVRLRWPTRVAAHPSGGVWAVEAHSGDPRADHTLVRVDADGRRVPMATTPPVVELRASPRGDAVVLLREGLWSYDEAGRRELLASVPEASALVAGGAGWFVGTDAGEVWSLGSGARVQLDGAIEGLCNAEVGSDLWALVSGSDGCRIVRLSAELHPLFATELDVDATAFCVDRSGAVWALDSDRARAQVRLPGRLEPEPPFDLSLVGASAVVPAAVSARAGVVVAAPGALLRLDAAERHEPAQGGFGFLSDLCVVR